MAIKPHLPNPDEMDEADDNPDAPETYGDTCTGYGSNKSDYPSSVSVGLSGGEQGRGLSDFAAIDDPVKASIAAGEGSPVGDLNRTVDGNSLPITFGHKPAARGPLVPGALVDNEGAPPTIGK